MTSEESSQRETLPVSEGSSQESIISEKETLKESVKESSELSPPVENASSSSPSSEANKTSQNLNTSTDTTPGFTTEEKKDSSCESPTPSEEEDKPLIPGSLECPYRLAIVGGGPAGTSIIVRAIHLDVINELCSFGAHRDASGVLKKQAGICLFDSSSPDRFGGGRLQDYVINSNTFGGKFVTNVVQDKLNVIPPEKASGTVLECLAQTKMAEALGKYGTDVAPLSDIGVFLVEVGGQVKKLIDYYRESSKYECNCEVTQLQQSACKQYWKITSLNLKSKIMTETYAYRVVLATGGKQNLPRLSPSSRNSKLMTSDDVCTNHGIAVLQTKLENKDKRKIVIIGGSHSAFSAAWICLNKLTLFTSDLQIYIVHRTAVKVFYATKREAEKDKYYDYDAPNKCGQIHPFGGLRGDAKKLYRDIKKGQETKIRLLCTGADGSSHQTMANKLQEEAHVIIWACGYAANTSISVLDNEGSTIKLKLDRGQVEVNDLAMVMRDDNPKKSLSKLPTPSTTTLSEVASALSNNKPLPVVDSPSSPIKPSTVASISSPVLRKSSSYCQPDPRPVGNLLGTGLGFGLSLGSGESAKADGVAVYLKRGATLILSHVLGPKVFGENASTWEQHVAVNLKRSAMISLQLQREDKIEKDRTNELNNSVNIKLHDSPTKSSRNMMFDPSSPSNASTTGIGAGIGFSSTVSPIKRTASTAPHGSRSRPSNKNASDGNDIKSAIAQDLKKASKHGSGAGNNNNNQHQRISRKKSMPDDTHQKRGSTAHARSRPPLKSSPSMKQSPTKVKKEISAQKDVSVDTPPSNNIIEGVSVLNPSDNVDDDPPPTYRSSESSAEKKDNQSVLFPQVSGVSADKEAENVTKSPSTIVNKVTTPRQQYSNESMSRLCQPKNFTRSPQVKKKSLIEVPKPATLVAKEISEFVLEVPSEKKPESKDMRGQRVKMDDKLCHVGSDNIHFQSLKPAESNNSLVTPRRNDFSQTTTPRSRRQSPRIQYEDCGSGGNTSVKAWENSNQSSLSACRPPMSPIAKGNIKRAQKENNSSDNQCTSAKDNKTNGPSVADILWAEKRNAQQKASKAPLSRSPITKKESNEYRAKTCDERGGRGSRNGNSSRNKNRSRHKEKREIRSPVPSSAPVRSKRILSQSLDGPPVAMLKLPSLQGDNESDGGVFKKVSKPVLYVKHDVFKSHKDQPVVV